MILAYSTHGASSFMWKYNCPDRSSYPCSERIAVFEDPKVYFQRG